MNKELSRKILKKRINVRVEARHSSSAALAHRAGGEGEGEAKRRLRVRAGKKTNLKRQPILPKAGYKVKLPEPETMQPI